VPALFKLLRYPFQLSKSSLLNVGSPHTWPSILAALHWLVELLIFQEVVQERQEAIQQAALEPLRALTDGLSDDSQSNLSVEAIWRGMDRLFFDAVAKSYAYFLQGDDASADQTMNEFLQLARMFFSL